MAMLIYWAGVKKKELPKIKIKDILNEQGDIVNALNIGGQVINLPTTVKQELHEYIDYQLERDPGPMDPNRLLFPGYSCGKRIYRHLKRHFGTFHTLGRERVKCLYLEYRKAGIENEEAYEKVADQFRLTTKRVRDIIFNVR